MRINKNYKRGIFLLILLLTVIFGTTLIQNVNKKHVINDSTLSTSAPEDFYEPNNDPTSAYDLTMFELTWLSMINGPGAQWDEDWYRIDITPGSERLVVKLIFKHIEGDIDLEVYNSTLDLITGSYSVEDGEFIDILLPSGQYFLKVYFGNAGNNYDLLWDDMNPALTDDFYEENDAPGSANVISANQGMWLSQINELGIQADEDWYEIHINSGFERLIVDCVFSNSIGNIDMDIYNSTLFMVGGSWTDQNHEFIDFVVPSSGVYYIRLHYGNGGNTYDLRWDSLIPGPMDDSYEENDFDWEAYDLSPWPASWLPFGLGIQADDDWFMIFLDPGEERMIIDLMFPHSLGNIDMEVWYWDGVFTYLTGSYSMDDNEYIDAIAPWPGTYFIKVYGDNMANQYDLWWEDLSPTGADDWAEENDDFWTARWVNPDYYSDLKIVGYDEDWFQLYLNYGDTIDVAIRNFDHNIGDLQLELFHPDNYFVIGSYSSSPIYHEESISYTVQDPGDWRIRVYRVSGVSDVNYDLDIKINKREPTRDDPYEWNNHFDEAYNLIEFELTWLTNIHGPAVSGDEDWYKIKITPGFNHLIVDLKFNNSRGNIDISIVDEWNFWYIENTSRTSVDNFDINCLVPHPGIYFIRIFGDFMHNKYNLIWDDLRTDFRSEDFYEENDDSASAYDLSSEIQHEDDYGILSRPLWQINGPGLQYDNDWYKLDIGSEFLQLILRVFYEYDAGALGVKIYDWDLAELTGNFTMDDNEYINYELPSNGTYYIRIYGDNSGSPYGISWELKEIYEKMIPGYDILILLGAIFGVVTVITMKWKRSKRNL